MNSVIYEPLWKGYNSNNMDYNSLSSVYLDDDFLDWGTWPASSPKRCDRELANEMSELFESEYTMRRSSGSQPSSSSSSGCSREEPFFYCTEELGSESTLGVGDMCAAPIISYNISINKQQDSTTTTTTTTITPTTTTATTTTSTTTERNSYTCIREYRSSSQQQASAYPTSLTATHPHFDSEEVSSSSSRSSCIQKSCISCRSTHEEDYNWASYQQSFATTTFADNTRPEEASSSSCKISSNCHTSATDAAPHHHLHPGSSGGHCTFPPPISSLLSDRPLMRSFKSNGRFILKKVANVSRSLFRSTRKDGRLRLDLLSSPFDSLESQYALLFPASSILSPAAQDATESNSTQDLIHDDVHDLERPGLGKVGVSPSHFYFLNSPSPSLKWDFSLLSHKSTLNYEALCPPSKLQALAMLMHSKGPCSPFVEEPTSPLSTTFQACHLAKARTGANSNFAHPMPHVFAFLNLTPIGLGLIIFEFGQSKVGDHVTLYGIYILKSFGYQCSRETISPSNRFPTSLCGISGKVSKGTAQVPFEDCKKVRHWKGVFS